jgi:hypothetical protein
MSTVGDIAAAVGKIAGESLEKMGGMAETAAVKMERFNATVVNLKTNLGKVITESKLFANALNSVNTALVNVLNVRESEDKIQESSLSKWDKFIFKLARFTKVGREAIKTMGEGLKKQEELNAKIEEMPAAAPSAAPGITRAAAPGMASFGQLTMPKSLNLKSASAGLQMDEIKINEVTEALQYQEEIVYALTDAFRGMFDNVEGGFDKMIKGMLQAFKRYVQEVIARAAVLALLNIIAPGSSMAINAHKSLGSLVPLGGGKGLFGNRSVASASGPMEFKIYGKDLKTVLQRNG